MMYMTRSNGANSSCRLHQTLPLRAQNSRHIAKVVHEPPLLVKIYQRTVGQSRSGIERMRNSGASTRYWWRSMGRCFQGSCRRQVCISCRLYVAAANPVAGPDLNTSNGNPPGDFLDDDENRINADPKERQAQLKTILDLGQKRMDEKKIEYTIAG